MAMQLDPITLEDAAALLGGIKPWSRKTVERMIAAGLLHDYGRGATRRVLKRDVETLIERFATGEVTWPQRKERVKNEERPEASTNTPKVRGSGSQRSKSKPNLFVVAPLQSKPPKRG